MAMALNEGNHANFVKSDPKNSTGDSSGETTFFNTKEIHPNDYYENLKRSAKIREERANIDDQISSIVHHVHTELYDRKRNIDMKKYHSKRINLILPEKKKKVEEKEVQTRLTTIDVPVPQRSFTNIPRIKALYARKNQERRFYTVPPNNRNHYEQQQRVKELLRQRAILENMLVAHKKLQRDRQSIVHEIHMMRNYLDDIRGRLDTSLKKLNITSAIADSLSPNRRSLKFKSAFK